MPGSASYVRFAALLTASLPLVATAVPAEPDERVEPPAGVMVAAVTYAGLSADKLGCSTHACALETLVRRAAERGAQLIVLPEYALLEYDPEPAQKLGEIPDDPKRAPAQTRFARLADELDVYLVVDLHTRRLMSYYNTQVAYGPDGRALARHDKFELFEGERELLKAGREVSAFDTPFGRVGLLICADMYGDPRMHERLDDLDVDIIAVSSQWTAKGAPRWPLAFAHDWGVHVVAANGAIGAGKGAMIASAGGTVLAQSAPPGEPLIVTRLPIAPNTRAGGSKAP